MQALVLNLDGRGFYDPLPVRIFLLGRLDPLAEISGCCFPRLGLERFLLRFAIAGNGLVCGKSARISDKSPQIEASIGLFVLGVRFVRRLGFRDRIGLFGALCRLAFGFLGTLAPHFPLIEQVFG